MTLLLLCYEFFKIGLFAVGGGLATLPFLTQLSYKYPAWFSTEMLANMVAVGESTPGPIGVNMATYVGYTVAGVPGAILATLSLVAPSILIVVIISGFLKQYQENRFLQGTFGVLRPAVTGLIAAAGYSVLVLALMKTTGFTDWNGFLAAVSWPSVLLFAVMAAALQWKRISKLHPILFIAVGAVAGIVFQL